MQHELIINNVYAPEQDKTEETCNINSEYAPTKLSQYPTVKILALQTLMRDAVHPIVISKLRVQFTLQEH